MFLTKVSMQLDSLDRIERVPSDPRLTITSAVGDGFPPRCRNLEADVRKIQAALNRFTPLQGGPLKKLEVDGIAGKLTKGAIHRFQRKFDIKVKGKDVDDGIVDVEGPTIEILRAGPGALIPDAPALFLAQIPLVIGIVTAAQAALSLALAQLDLPNPLGGGGSELEKHFHAKTDEEKRSTIALAQKVFTRIQAAIGHLPTGRVLAIDQAPQLVSSLHGWIQSSLRSPDGRGAQWEGLDVDRIYITPRARTLAPEQFRYCMVHELAHFISNADGMPPIDDFAYFHRQRAKYDALTNFTSVRNADCYSRFAFAAIGRGDAPILS